MTCHADSGATNGQSDCKKSLSKHQIIFGIKHPVEVTPFLANNFGTAGNAPFGLFAGDFDSKSIVFFCLFQFCLSLFHNTLA